MTNTILAISTCGSQRVQDPTTQQTVSAHKIGYTSAAAPILLALYGERARNVSPHQASYVYIQIEGETVVRHGYILLNVTAEEIARAETTARHFHRAAAYLWREGVWRELPNSRTADYAPVQPRSGPDFNPVGFRPPSPSTGERESVVKGITVERSQREEGGSVWWWLLGETYPHRQLLKRHGARFSGKRKAWYFVGDKLPNAIARLVTGEAQCSAKLPNDEPGAVDEAAAILGMPVKEAPAVEPPPLFQIGQTVYARHELETPDGKAVLTGTQGTIARLYNRNATHGWSYDVDFEGIGVCWSFERELTPHEPLPGIKITRGAVAPPGAALPLTDAEIQRTLIARLTEGIEYGQKSPVEEVAAAEPEIEASTVTDEAPLPAIRIFRPASIPAEGEPLDAVQTAIRTVKTQPLVLMQQNTPINGRVARIEQASVGELTGSITGNVWCYGYAVHEGICVYLNMGGPRMAVEAIRAKLSKGDIVNCVPWDAPAIELTAGEGNSGMFHDFMQNIPEAKFTSLILRFCCT